MLFYRLVLKAGHAGSGHYRDFIVYVYAETYAEAMKCARSFPMVKHRGVKTVQSLEQINEREYIIGILQNVYYCMSSYEYESIRTLKDVIKTLERIDRSYIFETKEAKGLKLFCDRYKQAKDNQKILIEKEYLDWANKLIEEYENEKYNFPKLK